MICDNCGGDFHLAEKLRLIFVNMPSQLLLEVTSEAVLEAKL